MASDGLGDAGSHSFGPVDVLGRCTGRASPPNARSANSLGEGGEVVGQQFGEQVAQLACECRARTVGADGDGHATRAGDGGQDELAVDRVGRQRSSRCRGPAPAAETSASTSATPVAVTTRRTPSRSASSKAGSRISATSTPSTIARSRRSPRPTPGRPPRPALRPCVRRSAHPRRRARARRGGRGSRGRRTEATGPVTPPDSGPDVIPRVYGR